MNNYIKYLSIGLFIFTSSARIIAQDIFVTGGVGFYTLYDEKFHTGEFEMSPTPVISAGLKWKFSDFFSLSWENSFRFKSARADYIGIDTVSLKKGINSYREFNFFNFDTKVLGTFSLLGYENGNLFTFIGTGISIPLVKNAEFHHADAQYVLSQQYYSRVSSGGYEFFFDGNILAEAGIGSTYKNISLTLSFLTEFFKVSFYDVGSTRSSLIQINIVYNI